MGHLGLKVSPYLRTSVAHIYAAGDAAGNTQLTPVAAYEGRLAARNALEGDRIAADERIVPQTVFTTPEIAKVGLTHREVEASGVRCHVATHDMRGASNGRATGEDDGYLKLVFDAADERLLGVQMVVPDDAPAGALGQQEDPQGCLWLASRAGGVIPWRDAAYAKTAPDEGRVRRPRGRETAPHGRFQCGVHA